MRIRSVALVCVVLISVSCGSKQTPGEIKKFTNPLLPSGPDPWVVRHNGMYYFTHSTGQNLKLYRTPAMSDIATAESKVVWTPPEAGMNSKEIWAPEIHRVNDKWYFYYAADDGDNQHHRMWVLENSSDDPFTGTWVDKGKLNLADDKWAIDGTIRAFDTNKSVNYIVRQDARRVDRMRRLMSYSFDVCDKFGDVWISDAGDACALILFMDKKRTSLRTLFWDLQFAMSVVGLGRVGEILKREAMIKSNHPMEPFAYLWFFGVDPGAHNKGIGSAFLEEIIRECDRKKRPIYLETSMEKNLPFYKKFGFEIFNTVQPTYTLYLLRRS